jgi:gamma-glutamyltranspeptidase/glutathione hydrolase
MTVRCLLLVATIAACKPSAAPYAVVAVPDAWPYRSDSAAVTGTDVVASDAPLASRAGIEILAAGGNAVDAAVATGFALAVVYPEAGNLGGGGFTVIRMADGTTAAIDYREVAPLAATRTMFLDDSGRATNRSVVGPLASGVPGSVAGLIAAHTRFGSLPRARVMAPAIRLASEGFAVDSQLARSLDRHSRLIAQFAGAQLFLPDGKALTAGATLRQPALARTLRAIADSGAGAFYNGPLSQIVAADLRAAGSIITAEDLRRYQPAFRAPLRGTYRELSLITMPPPSSGVTLLEALNILEGFEMPRFGSARYAHRVAAALQRAFTDRNALLGDPAFIDVPVERLVSKEHAAAHRATIGPRALPSRALPPPEHDGAQTTHYAVVDRAGNAVSTTTTINDLYGSGVYLPNAGFFMNDEMDDFAANPGKPNLYGLIQGEQNAIQPGKRMLSSMVPTIVMGRDDRPLLIVGGRGGPRIISATLQTILNVLDHRMSVVDAVNAPRLHHQALPDTIRYERDGFTATMLDSLGALGWGVAPFGNIASINAILRTPRGWVGYSDPRSGGRPAAR